MVEDLPMRYLAVVLVLALLSACGTSARVETASVVTSRFQAPETFPRYAIAANAGAPVLQVAFVETNTSTTLVLERQTGPFQYWLSTDGVQIVLEDGMLHGTRGIGEGLLASDLSEPLARLTSLQEGRSTRFHTYLTGNDEAVTRTFECDIRRTRETTIAVVGGEFPTILFREACNSLDQEFENLYWVNPQTRQIIQSRQWVGPRVSDLSTRIVLQ